MLVESEGNRRGSSSSESDDDFKERARRRRPFDLARRAAKKRIVPSSMVKRTWPFLGKPRRKTQGAAGASAPRETDDAGGTSEGEKENLCPVCKTNLLDVSATALGRQAHVNACLDSQSAERRKDEGEEEKRRGEPATPSVSALRPPPRAPPRARAVAPKPAASVNRGSGAPSSSAPGSPPPWSVLKQQSHVIRGTPGPFAVDCFNGRQSTILGQKGTQSWFLSHFHYDHYIGLKKDFSKGQIYCTKVTAKLIHHIIGVPLEVIFVVELNRPVAIQGVRVTALDANHCPGACMFLFEPAGEVPTLHTGDARLTEEALRANMGAMARVRGKCALILDTTYCSLRYASFPSQRRVIEDLARVCRAELASNPKVLILVGTYTIGKEAVFFELARALGTKVYIGANKRRVIKCLDLSQEERDVTTSNDKETCLHAVPLGYTRSQKRMEGILKHYKNKFTGIVAICPTGWSLAPDNTTNATNEMGKNSEIPKAWMGPKAKPSKAAAAKSKSVVTCRRRGKVVTYSAPYSEHSSYGEMRAFVHWLQPTVVIPFVKVSDQRALSGLRAILDANKEKQGAPAEKDEDGDGDNV